MILSQENILLSTNLFGQEVRQRLVEDYASSAFRAELFQNIIRDNWFGIDFSGTAFGAVADDDFGALLPPLPLLLSCFVLAMVTILFVTPH